MRQIVESMIKPLALIVAMFTGSVIAQPIHVDFYYGLGGTLGAFVEELVSEYNASQSDVVVRASFQGTYDETANRVMADLAAGTAPNLAMVSLANIPQFTQREGLIVDLRDYTSDPEFDAPDMVSALVEAGTFDGRVYAMPFNVSTQLFFWNKDLFRAAGLDPERPPENWDELREFARAIDEIDPNAWGFAAFGAPFEHWLLEYFFWANDASILDESATGPAFDSPEAIEALEFIDTLVNQDTSTIFLPYGETVELFTSGRAGMAIASTGALGGIRANAGFEFGGGHLPEGPARKVTSLGGGFLMMLASDDEVEAATWDFVRFLVNTENTVRMNTRTGYMPVRISARESAELQAFWEEVPQAQAAVTQLPYARARLTHARLKEVHDILARVMSNAITENVQSPADALRQGAAEARRALAF